MDSSLQLTSVTLRVPDLDRSLAFYADRLGFTVKNREGTRAELAADPAGPALLTLAEDRTAPPASPETAGLFHAAMLLRDRAALGAWLRRAGDAGVEFDGFADHGVSDALYLTDPDGNGLEFYTDRPRGTWPRTANGELAMFTHPLDLRGLMAEGAKAGRAPLEGAHWGHLHLRVTQLERSEAFYRDLLGLATTQSSFPGARFLAVDGYHHHVGLNTWTRSQQPRPAAALGLAEAVFRGSTIATRATVSDPDGIPLRLEPGIC
jgi:catechol 2,3-dioxygenase